MFLSSRFGNAERDRVAVRTRWESEPVCDPHIASLDGVLSPGAWGKAELGEGRQELLVCHALDACPNGVLTVFVLGELEHPRYILARKFKLRLDRVDFHPQLTRGSAAVEERVEGRHLLRVRPAALATHRDV